MTTTLITPPTSARSRPPTSHPNPFSISIYGDPDARDRRPRRQRPRARGPGPAGRRPRHGRFGLGSPLGPPPARLRPGPGPGRGPLRGPRPPRPGRPPARRPGIQPPAPQDVQPVDAGGRRPRNPLRRRGPPPPPRQPPPVPGRRRRRRPSEFRRSGRSTDARVARALGLGGKDLYRQARAVWQVARDGDPRASSSLAQLDAGTKSIHAAYKDLRRRDRFSAGFRPTPYDVWSFKHDRAFGVPHPGSIPPAIVAHALHYYTAPGATGRRPDGRRRHDARRLRVDGTPLPCV